MGPLWHYMVVRWGTSDNCLFGFFRAVRDTESVVDDLVTGLGAGGFTDVKGFSIGVFKFDSHAVLPAELSAQTFAAEMDAAGLELNTNHMHEVIGQHRDKQMCLHSFCACSLVMNFNVS
jgi:hypothetical protein